MRKPPPPLPSPPRPPPPLKKNPRVFRSDIFFVALLRGVSHSRRNFPPPPSIKRDEAYHPPPPPLDRARPYCCYCCFGLPVWPISPPACPSVFAVRSGVVGRSTVGPCSKRSFKLSSVIFYLLVWFKKKQPLSYPLILYYFRFTVACTNVVYSVYGPSI